MYPFVRLILITCLAFSSATPRLAGASANKSAVVLPAVGERFVRTELYFGLGRKNGGEVSVDEWNKFIAGQVTPRFPNGLTVVEAVGQYRNVSGSIIRERSRVLILLYKGKDSKTASKKIEEIRA